VPDLLTLSPLTGSEADWAVQAPLESDPQDPRRPEIRKNRVGQIVQSQISRFIDIFRRYLGCAVHTSISCSTSSIGKSTRGTRTQMREKIPNSVHFSEPFPSCASTGVDQVSVQARRSTSTRRIPREEFVALSLTVSFASSIRMSPILLLIESFTFSLSSIPPPFPLLHIRHNSYVYDSLASSRLQQAITTRRTSFGYHSQNWEYF
jgi:hypothetical protein